MKGASRSELINAEQALDEAKALVVKRLKRLGADSREAIILLLNLIDLQQSRERRLSYLRLRGSAVQKEITGGRTWL